MMQFNEEGFACCGNCRSELEVTDRGIVCTGGCQAPDVTPPENPIASLPLPMGKETPRSKRLPRILPPLKPVPPHCTWEYGCTEPVVPRDPTKSGRPPRRCEKHLAYKRVFYQRRKAA